MKIIIILNPTKSLIIKFTIKELNNIRNNIRKQNDADLNLKKLSTFISG